VVSRVLLAAAGVVLISLAGLLFAVAPLTRPAPAPVTQLALPAAVTIPGTLAPLPWPRTGQAAIDVAGIGRIGTSGSQTPAPIASVTKMMTAYAILTAHPLRTGEQGPTLTVTAQQAAAYQGEAARSESLIPVRAGAVFTERQALTALMLPSANNMARILGAWDSGSVPAFVAKMNAIAAVLGMDRTHYTDPSGFDPGTVSTAEDQVVLAEQAMSIPAFAEIVAQRTATVPMAGPVRNSNRLLGLDGVIGIKTGSTTQSGGCLVFAVRVAVAGVTVTIVGAVLGQPGTASGPQLANVFAAAQPLIRAVPKVLGRHTVIAAGRPIAVIRGPAGRGTLLATTTELTVLGWPGLTVRFVADIPPIPKELAAGRVFGRLAVQTGDRQTVSTALRSGEGLAALTMWARIATRT
jgi:D-alanyl-D-alanine carboxypeptidase (penicillin-binding protein 5/6)